MDRTTRSFRDTRLIVIATEGAVTEKQYFAMFRNSRVQVRVLPTERDPQSPKAGYSAPKHVLRRLSEYKKEFELGRDDQLWLMIDVDRWPVAQLAEVAQGALQKSCQLAVSNPAFELWLHMHHADVDPDRGYTAGELESMLRSLLGGFNKAKLREEDFRDGIEDAIARAENLDASPGERWPNATGTHVYRTVKAIQSLSFPAN